MPEYLSPGVYIEETSYRAKSIQGVATSTAGFVGMCRSGPVQGPPPLVTSFEEFRRTFGGLDDLLLGGAPTRNYLAHAVKAFFDNGGQRVYIARVLAAAAGKTAADYTAKSDVIQKGGARLAEPATTAGTDDFASGSTPLNPRFFARYPGNDGNLPVAIGAVGSGNLLSGGKVMGARLGDVVQVVPAGGSVPGRNVAVTVAPLRATINTLTVPGHGLTAGTTVTLASSGTLPSGLAAGTTYHVVSPTTDTFQVAATAGGAPIAITSAGSGTITVTATVAPSPVTAVDHNTTTLTVAAHGFSAGQAVTLAAGTGGALPAGLTAGTTYFVLNPSTDTFQLSASSGGALLPITDAGTSPIEVSPVVAPRNVTLVDPAVTSLTAPNHQLAANQLISFASTGTLPGGLTAGTAYYAVNVTPSTFQVSSSVLAIPLTSKGTGTITAVVTKAVSSVDTNSSTLTVPAHGLAAGQAFTVASTGNLPGGLAATTTYYVVSPTADTLRVAAAAGGAPIPLTSAGTGTISVSVTRTVTVVDPKGSTLTVPNHGFAPNQAITVASTGTLPGGLSAGTTYYVINVTGNTFQVASAQPLTIAGAGSGAIAAFTFLPSQLHAVSFDDQGNVVLTDASNNHPSLATAVAVRRVALSVRAGIPGGRTEAYSGLSTHPTSPTYIGTVLRSDNPADSAARIYFGFDPAGGAADATLDPASFADLFVALAAQSSPLLLQNGGDGIVPTNADPFVGSGTDATATGLTALADVDDIAIVAAPDGATFEEEDLRQAIRDALITHCETLRYRFAILSAGGDLDAAGIRNARGQHDSTYAAIYYPWVTVPDPFSQTGETLDLPPDGFVAGIYARSDVERGVHKAPANEVVRGALRFSRLVNKREQDTLNPEGINCLRFFEGRGHRVWGARTISSDPEWMYLNVRRLFIYLEHSIDKNTQWCVFEPNNESLWLRVRLTIESFLLEVWRTGALMGTRPEDAFFVRCDRTTMTQSDLDNGRLIVLIGVAPTKPAEFVVFRIGQWTADASIV